VAAPAEGKEVLSAKVCGANGCETSRDRALIADLAEGGNPVDPPKAAAPFFRVRLTIGGETAKAMDRFWSHFMPNGELIRGSDGTWMPAGDAYTGALNKIVNPSMEAYPASGLGKLLPAIGRCGPTRRRCRALSSPRSRPPRPTTAGSRRRPSG
jgi:hypothetical protein